MFCVSSKAVIECKFNLVKIEGLRRNVYEYEQMCLFAELQYFLVLLLCHPDEKFHDATVVFT